MVAFCNTDVTVIPDPTQPSGIRVELVPPSTYVTTSNTVLNYSMSAATPPQYVFTGITDVTGPADQFSTASVSIDGRMITFSDLDSLSGNITFLLQIHNTETKEQHTHDPDVVNIGR